MLAAVPFPVPEKALKQLSLRPHVEGHVRLRIPAKNRKEHVGQIVVRSTQRTTNPEQIQMLQAMMSEAVPEVGCAFTSGTVIVLRSAMEGTSTAGAAPEAT